MHSISKFGLVIFSFPLRLREFNSAIFNLEIFEIAPTNQEFSRNGEKEKKGKIPRIHIAVRRRWWTVETCNYYERFVPRFSIFRPLYRFVSHPFHLLEFSLNVPPPPSNQIAVIPGEFNHAPGIFHAGKDHRIETREGE